MLKLYEISSKYEDVLNDIECNIDQDGEIDPSFIDKIKSIEEEFSDKCENIVHIIKNLEAEEKACEAEEKRFYQRKASAKKKKEWLKNYLLKEMERIGHEKINTLTSVISIKKNPCSLEITNEELIDPFYIKMQRVLDKENIKKDLKNGIVVNGAVLKNTKSVQIK